MTEPAASSSWKKCRHCPKYYVVWQPEFLPYHLENQVRHESGECVPPRLIGLTNRAMIGPTEMFYGSLLLLIFVHWWIFG